MNILINTVETNNGAIVIVDLLDDFVSKTSTLREEASDLLNASKLLNETLSVPDNHPSLWPIHCTAGIPGSELETHFNGLVSKLPKESFIPEVIKKLLKQDFSLELLPEITGIAIDPPVLTNTIKLISESEFKFPSIGGLLTNL